MDCWVLLTRDITRSASQPPASFSFKKNNPEYQIWWFPIDGKSFISPLQVVVRWSDIALVQTMWNSSLALSLAAFTVLFSRSSVQAGRLYSLQDNYQGLSFFVGFDCWTVGNQDQPSQSLVVGGKRC